MPLSETFGFSGCLVFPGFSPVSPSYGVSKGILIPSMALFIFGSMIHIPSKNSLSVKSSFNNCLFFVQKEMALWYCSTVVAWLATVNLRVPNCQSPRGLRKTAMRNNLMSLWLQVYSFSRFLFVKMVDMLCAFYSQAKRENDDRID